MTIPDVLNLAGQFGVMGLFVGYLIWKDLRADKIARERLEADKALATALALLEATVKGRR
jgi:F0F1-type ATP synthase membrane subunit b/b'